VTASDAPELPDVEVLDVFEIDERGRLVVLEPARRPAPLPPSVASARAMASEPTPATPPRPASTSRPSAAPPVSTPKLLGRRDVRCAAFVDPIDAADRLVNDGLLRDVRGVEVGPGAPSVDGATISWAVAIRRRSWNRWRTAELCVHPSPSWVMTMIELRPIGGRRLGGGFVRAGLPIVIELSDRLVAAGRRAMTSA
jgi:hypothetical protein